MPAPRAGIRSYVEAAMFLVAGRLYPLCLIFLIFKKSLGTVPNFVTLFYRLNKLMLIKHLEYDLEHCE